MRTGIGGRQVGRSKRTGVWSQTWVCVYGDKYGNQEHEKGVRGQVNGDIKLQETGYVCVGCCIPRSKPSALHMVGAQDIFVS